MSELEDLPSWAGRLTREVDVPRTSDQEDEEEETATTADTSPADAAAATAADEAVDRAGERPDLAPRTPAGAAAEMPEMPAEPPTPEPPAAGPATAATTPIEPGPTEATPVEPPPTLDVDGIGEAPAESQSESGPEPVEVAPDEPQEAVAPLVAPTVSAAPAAEQIPAATSTLNQASATTALPETEAVTALPAGVPPPRRRSPVRTALLALLGLAILAGAGYGVYLLANLGDSEETATVGGDQSAGAADADAATDGVATDATETDDGDTEEAVGATDDGDATDPGDTEEAGTQTVTVEVDGDGTNGDEAADDEAPMNDGDRQAFFRGGKVYLTGAVPSEEVAEVIVQKAAAVVGPDNVVNEYTVDPSTTINPGDSAPLYVEDVILFDFNSVEIATPFLPILDLGVLLLSQNPQASITVVTRTDAIGSSEVNMEVASQRADAVIRYWLGRGVDRDQIEADPRGEEGASEDDDPETAARQRRAEFIITGLLD